MSANRISKLYALCVHLTGLSHSRIRQTDSVCDAVWSNWGWRAFRREAHKFLTHFSKPHFKRQPSAWLPQI